MPRYVKPSPCLGCKDRWVSANSRCHSTCERYAQWRAEAEKDKLQRDTLLAPQRDADAYEISVKERIRRRKK